MLTETQLFAGFYGLIVVLSAPWLIAQYLHRRVK